MLRVKLAIVKLRQSKLCMLKSYFQRAGNFRMLREGFFVPKKTRIQQVEIITTETA